MDKNPLPGNPMGDGSRQFTYPAPVNTGWDYAAAAPGLLAGGVYVPDRKHLGIGVGDMALVQPTGDPAEAPITRTHAGHSGVYVPAGGGFGAARTTALNQSDGTFSPRTLNPVPPMTTLATQEVVYTDLAGDGGVLQGTFLLTPLLDFQNRTSTGSGAVGG